jgi:hypothetical protein
MKVFILLSGLFFSFLSAQSDSLSVEEIVEIYSGETESGEISTISDDVISILENPIDINSATAYELKQIPLLNGQQIMKIIAFRDSINGYKNLDELNNISELNSADIKSISVFLSITPEVEVTDKSGNSERIKVNIRNRIISDYYSGFENPYSDNYKTYHRIKLNYDDNITFNSLIEKDQGENRYADFLSYSLRISNFLTESQIILGDYTVQFGQGLALWSAYASLKSTEAITGVNRIDKNSSPYTSTDEFGFLRGAAGTFKIGICSLSMYYSKKRIDATLDDNGNILTFRTDGYHRTKNDEEYRNNLKEQFIGVRTDIQATKNIYLSILSGHIELDRSFSESSNYFFVPPKSSFYSVAYNYQSNKFNLSGETSGSQGNIATINHLTVYAGNKVRLLTSFRNYEQDYFCYFSNPFGESSSVFKSERGFYTGIKINTGYGIINSYYDFFRIKRKYYDVFPFNGNEFMINYKVSLSRGLWTKLVYKNKNKELSQIDGLLIDKSNKFRIDLQYSVSKNLVLSNRYEMKKVYQTPEKGELFYQDVKYTLQNNLNLNLRFIIFGTDSYSTAIYEYENDLPGVFYNPPMFGEGLKWYINAVYKFLNFQISLKYSELTQYDSSIRNSDFSTFSKTKFRIGFQIEYSSSF